MGFESQPCRKHVLPSVRHCSGPAHLQVWAVQNQRAEGRSPAVLKTCPSNALRPPLPRTLEGSAPSELRSHFNN